MRNTLIRPALIRGTATAWTQQPQQQQFTSVEPPADPPEGDPSSDPPADPPTDPPADPPKDEPDWKKEARKWEDIAKKNKSKAEAHDKAEADKLDATQKAQKERDDAAKAVEETTAENARLRAALKYKLSDEDVDTFLTGVAADRVDDVAKALSKRLAKAAPAAGGAPAGGAGGKQRASTLDAAVAGHYTK